MQQTASELPLRTHNGDAAHEFLEEKDRRALLTTGFTTETQVDAAIQALAETNPFGILVFHGPEACALRFCPGQCPTVLTFGSAAAQVAECPQLPLMFYTEFDGPDTLGHFEAVARGVFPGHVDTVPILTSAFPPVSAANHPSRTECPRMSAGMLFVAEHTLEE